MKKIKSNISPILTLMLIIVLFFSACEEEHSLLYKPDVRTFTFSNPISEVFENDKSGIEVFVKIIGAHPEPGKLTISIHPNKDFEYGTHFTTTPDGLSGTMVVDVEKDTEFASFIVFPVNNNSLRTNKKIQFSIESYEGPSKLTNGILKHTVTIREDDVPPAGIFAFTSFEEPYADPSGIYTDPNRVDEEHDLINVANQNSVDFTSTGGEIGFDAIGFGSGISKDRFGVTDYTNTVGTYSDGIQGFVAADIDDRVIITFDKVTVPDQYKFTNFFMDVFLRNTTWEVTDVIIAILDIEYRDGTTETLTVVDIDGFDVDGPRRDNSGSLAYLQGSWNTVGTLDKMGVIEDVKTMQLAITLNNSSNSEEMYLDNLRFVYY